jgi:hypothetical protein
LSFQFVELVNKPVVNLQTFVGKNVGNVGRIVGKFKQLLMGDIQ